MGTGVSSNGYRSDYLLIHVEVLPLLYYSCSLQYDTGAMLQTVLIL